MKKIAIIGKGTGGALSALIAYEHCADLTNDCVIDWYFDDQISTQAVGEGSTLVVPRTLNKSINFMHHNLAELDGSFKDGISKKDWRKNCDYIHAFRPPNLGYHFNALKLQDFILSKLENESCVTLINKNVHANEIDADLVIDCSGKPDNYDDFHISDYISVNSVYVTQCYWDYPRFQRSLTDAMKYGWIFGIPLQNRCSIGYLYNNNITTLNEVKEDVKNVFSRYNLTPSETTNAFSFRNYYRKKNFTNNIVYNGNASFFLEPLEATSTSLIVRNARVAIDCLINKFDAPVLNKVNNDYISMIEEITTMIMLHYLNGSSYDTSFWKFANEKAEQCLINSYKTHQKFRDILKYCFKVIEDERMKNKLFNFYDFPIDPEDKKMLKMRENAFVDYGTWDSGSWIQNLIGLNAVGDLKRVLKINH